MFDRGAAAFARVLPEVLTQLPNGSPPVYVCPLCIRAYSADALNERQLPRGFVPLTEDHVPPAWMGGRRIVLTCKTCNSEAGRLLDVHMQKADRPIAILRSEHAGGQLIRVRINDGPSIKARLNSAGRSLLLTGRDKVDPPGVRDRFFSELGQIANEGRTDYLFHVDFFADAHDEQRARVGWLRTAYLAAFATFGYTYACGAGLKIVRQQIAVPDEVMISRFHMIKRDARIDDRLIALVREPPALAGIAVQVGWHIVFLPHATDADFYERLRSSRHEHFSGSKIEWPRQAVYLADHR
jgi:hypothetical protein